MSEQFNLTIDLGNDAMQTPEDVASALRQVALNLERSGVHGAGVMDLNGNTVGSFEFTEA